MWGEEPPVRWISIDQKKMSVRPNLWNFMNMARTRYPDVFLWIDAICINQAYTLERNHQVTQMGNIYSSAEHVLVWLGNSEPLVDFFLNTIRNFPAILDITSPHFELDLNTMERARAVLESHKRGGGELTNHEYWSRAWVTQELILSSNISVLVGDTELRMGHMSAFVILSQWIEGKYGPRTGHSRPFEDHVILIGRIAEIAIGARTAIRRPLPFKITLVRLLSLLPERKCGVLRDKVYSLLSIAEDGRNVAVDYEISDKDFIFGIIRACARTMCICTFETLATTFGDWEKHKHGTGRSPVPISELVIQRHSHSLLQHRPIFYVEDICRCYEGKLYVETSSKSSAVVYEYGSPLLHKRLHKRRIRFENNLFNSDGSGISLQPLSQGDPGLYVLRIGVPTLLSSNIFKRPKWVPWPNICPHGDGDTLLRIV